VAIATPMEGGKKTKFFFSGGEATGVGYDDAAELCVAV